MRLRDAQYAPYSVVFLLEGVAPAVRTAMPGALHELVRRNDVLRLRWPAQRGGRSLHPVRSALLAAAGACTTFSPDMDAARLIAATYERGFVGLPIALAVSRDRVTVLISHAVGDGAIAMQLLHDLVDLACGIEPVADERPVARVPLVAAVRSAGPGAFAALREHRPPPAFAALREHRPPPAFAAPEPGDLDERRLTARHASRVLSSDDLAAVTEARFPDGQRTSKNVQLATLFLAALRRVYTGERDMRVFIPVDLRHHVPDRRVTGNFVAVAPLGTLAEDWTPGELAARLAAARTGLGVAALVMGMLHHLRTARRPVAPSREYAISLPMIRSPRPFPESTWIDPTDIRLGGATIGPWPSAVFAALWTVGGVVHLSVWDETGLFDLDALGDAFDAEVALRRGANETR